jgi:hypothetical protein
MIDLKKEYKTTDGNAVKLFEIHEGLIIGMVIFQVTSPYPTLWELNGKHISDWKQFDLVEVKHSITHSAWVNVYENGFSRYTHITRESADIDAQEGRLDCIELKYETIK